ncbi:hypothetical protein C5F44_05995 [Fuscovulum blasticum DSM 2131]|uniref:Uncharacterized protein n=1 Tax=Fuscovulum blasticum DSM 2131 TaxID=1188250 RepID=A0A2T4JBT0_FUSBL|nr:hypothetical protein C5F44_05995 [Fuscovulum blasticum DSM 2131]
MIWEINDKERSITWQELQAMFRWLSKVPFALSMISASSAEQVGSRMLDNTENQEWWLAEFGLDLHKVKPGTT